MNKSYEIHSYDKYANINLPIIFHYDKRNNNTFNNIHWHENIEMLFFDTGIGEVLIEDRVCTVNSGEIAVINSGELHSIKASCGEAAYHCLIVDKKLCEQFGFFIDEQPICNIIKDNFLFEKINKITSEMKYKNEFYIPAVMSEVLDILTILYRNHCFTKTKYEKNKNLEMVKNGIRFIKKHFNQQLKIDDIAQYTGYSKYYFCRCFKEITGFTVNSYINSVKIEYAKEMLFKKETSISEISEKCGFSDISYFTKIFKKYTGYLPSRFNPEIY